MSENDGWPVRFRESELTTYYGFKTKVSTLEPLRNLPQGFPFFKATQVRPQLGNSLSPT
jgi:hypothetical protein